MPSPPPALDPARLRALAEHLSEPPGAVARTLRDELTAARERIEAALADDDLAGVAEAAHAARNSALMLDARPAISGLRALQQAGDCHDRAAARTAWEGALAAELTRLIEALTTIG